MSVYRRHKKTDYSVIDNHVFKDRNLTLKAKGLLATILSLPDEWKYSIEGLAALCSDGRTAVTSAINELIEAGYIIRTRSNDESGKFNGYVYDIYENPQPRTEDISEKPFTENPITDKPITGNQTVLNTNISNTKVLNTNKDNPPIIPREVAEKEAMFEQFWEAYPNRRKVNKKGCKAKFLKIENLAAIFPEIMSALEAQKQSKDWTKNGGEFVPMPLTWLNQERWTLKDTRSERERLVEDIAKEHFEDFLL